MIIRKKFTIVLTALAMIHSTISKGEATRTASTCGISVELSQPEFDDFIMFNARLSHLLYHYGKPTFESKLHSIVETYWPQSRVIQVSPFYFEKVSNLVEQARLRNAVALTVGIDSDVWSRFERTMKDITLMQSQGYDLANPMDVSAKKLIQAVSTAVKPAIMKSELWEAQKAETILRVSQMFDYMLRWRVLNGDLIEEKAVAASKSMAILAIGFIGAGVLCSTLVVSAPVVSGAGLIAARLATNPVTSKLLVKVAETAAGSAIGFFGAPAASVVGATYHTLSEAGKNSANSQTKFSCELTKQTEIWQKRAGQDLLSSALIGAGLGLGGGSLTLASKSAQAVLYATGFGVGVAQLYALGKMSMTTVESLAFYRLAEEAEIAGDHQKALEHLYHARDLAQEAGEHGLEAVIIAILSYHVGHNFMHALRKGSSAIRQLYAASADTLPTAAKAVVNLGASAVDMAKGKKTLEANP